MRSILEKFELIADENILVDQGGEVAHTPSLSDLAERNILKSPDSESVLKLRLGSNGLELFDKFNTYSIENGCPILYPKAISDNWTCNKKLPLKLFDNPLIQYTLLSQIKQSVNINAPVDSLPAKKHQWRFRKFCSNLSGLVLDVGSDKPSNSKRLFTPNCEYIGIDPYADVGEFRLIGLGEKLPIKNQSVDVVAFNTSLDHILDYHTAISEAHRVLKSRGTIIIASYAWIEKADLLYDSVHFHHFREYELLGALDSLFCIQDVKKYQDPKLMNHRYGLYISATKT